MKAVKEKMQKRGTEFKGSSVQKQVNNKTACPLLSTDKSKGFCLVYKNRPLTCRMAHSFSVRQCRLSFQKDRNKVQIPVSFDVMTSISEIIEGAFKALPLKEIDGNLYELSSAVLIALSQPDAALKWASGDHGVFKTCIKDDT